MSGPLFYYTLDTYEAVGIISLYFRDLDALETGMDEEYLPCLTVYLRDYTHVAYIAAAASAGEEDEVALACILPFNLGALSVLIPYSRADGIAKLLVDIMRETGAIECIGTAGCVHIFFSQMGSGLVQEVVDKI